MRNFKHDDPGRDGPTACGVRVNSQADVVDIVNACIELRKDFVGMTGAFDEMKDELASVKEAAVETVNVAKRNKYDRWRITIATGLVGLVIGVCGTIMAGYYLFPKLVEDLQARYTSLTQMEAQFAEDNHELQQLRKVYQSKDINQEYFEALIKHNTLKIGNGTFSFHDKDYDTVVVSLSKTFSQDKKAFLNKTDSGEYALWVKKEALGLK